uniref:RRM domain-containing protein n=1 Tax=Rodentolepis nana TaxID=102285 RepID=A0A0R3T7P5_RODNA
LRLFIGNLNPSVSREMLKEHFSRFGTVTKVDIICNRQSSKPRGMAFVNMSSEEEVEGVLKGCPHLLGGKVLIVRKAYKKNSEQDTDVDSALRRCALTPNDRHVILKDTLVFDYTVYTYSSELLFYSPLGTSGNRLIELRNLCMNRFASQVTTIPIAQWESVVLFFQLISSNDWNSAHVSECVGVNGTNTKKLCVELYNPLCQYPRVTKTHRAKWTAFVAYVARSPITIHVTQPKSLKPTTEVSRDTRMVMYDIPVNTSRQDLLQCFSKFGGITDLRIQDIERKGTLTFASSKALQEALKASPHQVRGKDLHVYSDLNPIDNYSTEPKKTLYIRVGDLAPLTTELELRVCLGQFGGVQEASVVKTGTQLHAIVKMISVEAVQKAVDSTGLKISGHYVTVRHYYPEPKRSIRLNRSVRQRIPPPSTSKSDPPRAEIKEGSETVEKSSFLNIRLNRSVRQRIPPPSTSKSDPPRAEIKEGSEAVEKSSLLKNVSDYYDFIYDSDDSSITEKSTDRDLRFWELF